MLNLDQALSFAISLAEEASNLLRDAHAKLLKGGNGELHIKTKSNDRDFVTDVDTSVQKFIVDRIRAAYPEHRFIGEEEGADTFGDPKSPFAWVIDPLDGTTNFIHASPNFGSMIALLENGKPVIGVVALPMRHQIYSAKKGGGAFRNGERLIVRKTRDMNDAILSTNLNGRAKECDGEMHVSIVQCASLHNYGCAACEMAAVAEGFNDGIYYERVGLWDIAPGSLIIEEAGGKAEFRLRDPDDVRKGVDGVASTKGIFEELKGFIFR